MGIDNMSFMTKRLLGLLIMAVCVIAFWGVAPYAYASDEEHHSHEQHSSEEPSPDQLTNTTCPVLVGNKVDPKLFTEYKGERVYFCCSNCVAAFAKNPEKYTAKLPQFQTEFDDTGHQHGSEGLNLAQLIKPMGIITLSLLVLTAIGRLFRKKVPKFLSRWHKYFGITTLISVFIHATLVLIAH